MSEEEWRPCIGFEKYLISSQGRVMNKTSGRILKPYNDKRGYDRVDLQNANSEQKHMKTHRLIAMAFIPNPEDKDFVDHIDRNRSNNNIDNLRWVTNIENCQNREIRDLPMHIVSNPQGHFIVRIMRNKQLYHKYCKTVEEAILWRDAKLLSLETNQNTM